MYSCPPTLSAGNTFQDPQWMAETVDSLEPYIYCIFLWICTYDMDWQAGSIYSTDVLDKGMNLGLDGVGWREISSGYSEQCTA